MSEEQQSGELAKTPPFQEIVYRVEQHVATVTLNRPHKRNALTPRMVNELIHALERAGADEEVGAIVLTGAGEAFCAGADLSQVSAPSGGDAESLPMKGGFVELNLAFTQVGKPVIAKVRRYALAGGLGLMCACQFAFAEEGATFGTPEIKRGLFPMMIMANIFRTVPRRRGLELVLLGERVSAQEAVDMGLINKAVPAQELDHAVSELAARLAAMPPEIMRLGLGAFYQQDSMALAEALPYLNGELMACLGTDDAREGLMAFMQKRTPRWR